MKAYRIYINDNTLYIASSLPEMSDDAEQLSVTGFSFSGFYTSLGSITGKIYVLLDADPKTLFKKIKKSCLIIKAAGGLVASTKGNYLFIFRNKKYSRN